MSCTIRTIGASAILSGLALYGCTPGRATTSSLPPSVSAARIGTFEQHFFLTGELQAVRSEKVVVPRTPSWQLPIRWMEMDGASVAADQKVLELDNSQFAGDLEQKQLAYQKTVNDLARKQAEVTLELATAEFALESQRIAVEKARLSASIPASLVPAREHEEKQLELQKAENEHAKAQDSLEAVRRATQAELEELQIALDKARLEIAIAEKAIQELTLAAPRDGILVVGEYEREARKYQVGDMVSVGTAVMSIPDLSEMQVSARLSDVDDGRITVGLATQCVLDTYPDRAFAGRVAEITPIAQAESNQSSRRSFRVTIPLEGADPERMRPGMSVRVEIRYPPLENVLLVPRRSVDLSVSPAKVVLADGTTAEVRLGPCGALECVVEEGLAEGTRLGGRG